MSTPTSVKSSAVSAFLGEAGAAPEAVVRVEVTGSPPAVQKAIQKLAKRPAKKLGGAPKSGIGGEGDSPPEEEIVLPPGEIGGEGGEGGEGPAPELDLDAEADEVVESLIQEGATPPAPTAAPAKK